MTNLQALLAKQNELARQQAEIEKQLTAARREERAGVINKIKAMLAEHGLTVDDLGIKAGAQSKTPSANAGRKVAPKYRNDATGETWTGRGLMPKWIQIAIDQGKSKDDFLI